MKRKTGAGRRRPAPPAAAARERGAVAARLDALFAAGDDAAALAAVGAHARASLGMAALAERAQLNRTYLYTALSAGGNPELRTFSTILDVLGLRLSVRARD